MSRVSISRHAAGVLLSFFDIRRVPLDFINTRAIEELRAALAPKRIKPFRKANQAAKARKKTTKLDRWAIVKEAVFRRADGHCENPLCGRYVGAEGLDPDHAFGRKRYESTSTVWALCHLPCHENKTLNINGAEYWWSAFVTHARRHGYAKAQRKAQDKLDSERDIQAAAELTAKAGAR